MLSIGKLAAGQAKYYLDQAEVRVDVVESVGDGIEDYYVGASEARGEWIGVGGARARARRRGRGRRAAARARRARSARRLAAADVVEPGSRRRLRPDVLGAEERERALRARRRRAAGARARRRMTRGSGGGRLSRAVGRGGPARARRARSSRRRPGSSPRRSGIGRRAPAIRSCTRTCWSRTSGAGVDGRWSALDGRRLYAHARTASFIYQAVLRGELTRTLGVEWTPVRDGIAEVVGVPRPVLRGVQSAAGGDRGRAGRARDVGCARGRGGGARDPAGEGPARRRPRRSSASGARARRSSGSAARSSARDRAVARPRESRARGLGAIAERLAGPHGLTRRARDVRAPRRAPGAVRGAAARRARRRADARGRGGRVPRDRARRAADPGRRDARDGRGVPAARRAADAGERRAAALLDARAPRAGAAARRARRRRARRGRRASRDADGRGERDRGAADAVRRAAARGRVAVPRRRRRGGRRRHGRAPGKTFALGAAREAWQAAGLSGARRRRRATRRGRAAGGRRDREHERRGAARRSRAAATASCRSGACSSSTRPGWCRRASSPSCSITSSGRRGKLVLVGDDRQLPAIEAGGAFRGLVQRGLAIELGENVRQAHVWEREALDHLRDGRAEEALALYGEHGALVVEPTAARDAASAGARLARAPATATA